MAIIVPTITAENPHVYREQIERVQDFAKRIHIDLMDGIFTPNKSVMPTQVWWPEGIEADIHLMFQNPQQHIDQLISLKPRMVVVHGESDGNIAEIASKLNYADIQCGVALLAASPVSVIEETLKHVQQLLIFSGNLGYQGGSTADLKLLQKITQAKAINPNLEIAWDGGVNESNVSDLISGGIEVVNVGGAIHRADTPSSVYHKMELSSNES